MNNNELQHYGVKGMKWGQRRAYRKDAKFERKRAENAAWYKYNKTINDIEKPYKRGQMLSKKDLDREAAADARYKKDMELAKTKYKEALQNPEYRAGIERGKNIAKKSVSVVGGTAVTAVAVTGAALSIGIIKAMYELAEGVLG